jgi:hypothetical protein
MGLYISITICLSNRPTLRTFIAFDFDSLLRIIEQWSNTIQMRSPLLHSIKSLPHTCFATVYTAGTVMSLSTVCVSVAVSTFLVMGKARCDHEQMNLGKANNVDHGHERTVSEPWADSEWSVSGPWVNRECENSRNWAIDKVLKILQKTEERKSYWLNYLHTARYKRVIRDDKFFRRHAVQKDVTDWNTFCVTLCVWTMFTDVSNDHAAFETHGATHLMAQRHFSQDLYRPFICV